ncbi:MAG: putative lipopolysaccharide heptosyltransferase III [Magnetococcales bacterium]|nr:putative lipopolysaccharide heptosyltransferase III [Magnetococcales bacterium]
MKILIVLLKHIGDTLLCTPTIAALRKRYPEARIDLVVRTGCASILKDNPDLTHVVEIASMDPRKRSWRSSIREWARLLKIVLCQRYDYAFDLSNSQRSKVVMALGCARVRAMNSWGVKPHWTHALCNRFSAYVWAEAHQVSRNYHTVMDIVASDEERPAPGPLVIGASKDLARIQEKIPGVDLSQPYLVIHPTSRWRFKQWSSQRWGEIIDWVQHTYGYQVILSSGPDPKEQADIQAILGCCTRKPGIVSGQLHLMELAGLFAGSRLFVGVDTMAMHMASAVQTPVVALFGPSHEKVWYPWQCRHELLVGNCSCKIQNSFTCDKSPIFPCMDEITSEAVMGAIQRILTHVAT